MNYSTVQQIMNSPDTNQAVKYIKKLWYAKEEGYLSFSNNYHFYKNEVMHLRAYAPDNWKLNIGDRSFSISKQIDNHGICKVTIFANGNISYTIH